MEKIRIEIPDKVVYRSRFTIDAADINEANHMGNERILQHANRIRHACFQELDLLPQTGHGLIIANHSIQYRSEGFLGDQIDVDVSAAVPTECSFDLVMHFRKSSGKSMAVMRSGLVYYDYGQRRIRSLPPEFSRLF